MELRPYQQEAREAVKSDWASGFLRTLLVLPTGCGKTIVFSKIVEDMVRSGRRCLILAHRGELLDQAADKLLQATGRRGNVPGQLVPGDCWLYTEPYEGETAGPVPG